MMLRPRTPKLENPEVPSVHPSTSTRDIAPKPERIWKSHMNRGRGLDPFPHKQCVLHESDMSGLLLFFVTWYQYQGTRWDGSSWGNLSRAFTGTPLSTSLC